MKKSLKNEAPRADARGVFSSFSGGAKSAESPPNRRAKGDKSQEIKIIEKAQIHVTATFNNTLVTITDMEGNVLCSVSSGAVGFKGARKATPFAATVTVEKALEKARPFGIKSVEILIKGPGSGRDAALRAIRAANLKIDLIGDVTPIPHNGCRPKKRRRV